MNKELTIKDIQRPEQVDLAIHKWWNAPANPYRGLANAETYLRATSEAVDVAILALTIEPVVPSEDQAEEMYMRLHLRRTFGGEDIHDAIEEWQRCMFLRKPDPVPDEVRNVVADAVSQGMEPQLAMRWAMQCFEFGKRLGSDAARGSK